MNNEKSLINSVNREIIEKKNTKRKKLKLNISKLFIVK